MAKQQLTDFTLPTDAYTAFDALSLKALIKDRLDQNSTFTRFDDIREQLH